MNPLNLVAEAGKAHQQEVNCFTATKSPKSLIFTCKSYVKGNTDL